MTATNPQPHSDEGPRPGDVKRGGIKALLVLVALVVVVAIIVALTNLGGDDDPSGGGEQGMGVAATSVIAGSA
jgi:hypothetical protein